PDLGTVGDLLGGDRGVPASGEQVPGGRMDATLLVGLVQLSPTGFAGGGHENHSVGGPASSRRENTIATTTSVTSSATAGERRAKARTRSGRVRGVSPSGPTRHGPSSNPRRSTDRSNGTVA